MRGERCWQTMLSLTACACLVVSAPVNPFNSLNASVLHPGPFDSTNDVHMRRHAKIGTPEERIVVSNYDRAGKSSIKSKVRYHQELMRLLRKTAKVKFFSM